MVMWTLCCTTGFCKNSDCQSPYRKQIHEYKGYFPSYNGMGYAVLQ